MNLKEVKELIELVSEKRFAEFEIERQGFRLRIRGFEDRADSQAPAQVTPLIVASPMSAPLDLKSLSSSSETQSASAPKQLAEAGATAPNIPESAAALHQIKSPIVGTFYRSPSPNSDPFISVGDRVSTDSVVCIIEAMKLMNEIHAEISGTVVEIYAENGQAVEYGQPLFGVRV